ncbi:MAG: ABC transporter permease, partial [Rhodanobacter sp.]|nr:ABC transporter permease [Rhodanobacter sp.]
MSGAGVLMGEVHQSWRGLLRRPGYLALAVLTLALGVATVTVVFSLLYQALLRPLPFPQPERLVSMGIEIEQGQTGAAPGYYESLKRMQTVESAGMLMSWAPNANIAIGERAEVVPALRADRGFLQTLGLPLAAGRNFDEDENRPNGPQAVILSYPFWRSHFDADPATIGRNLQVEGRSVQIVGVLPAAFQWPDRFDLLLSLQPDLADTDLSTNQIIIARLKPQVNLAAAAAETHNVLTALITNAPSATEEQREYLRRSPPTALPLQSSVFAQRTGDTLWMFLGAA